MIVLLIYLFLHALLIYSREYRIITDFNAISLLLAGSVLQVNAYLSSFFLRHFLDVARFFRHQAFAHDSNVGFEGLRNFTPLYDGKSCF